MKPPPLSPPREERFPGRVLAVVILLALLCRGTSLSNGFVNYDDPQIRTEVASKGPLDFFTGATYYAYKPIYGLSLWIDHVLYGDAPLGWHVGNWLLFALAAGLVALVVHALIGSVFVGGVAGLLFAAHPVHTESVAWVAERKDSLSLCLALLAHLAYRRARDRAPSRPSLLAPFLLVLAGLTKGTVWTYAGIVALDEILEASRTPARGSGKLRRLAPMIAVGILGIGLDAWFAREFGPGGVRHDATIVELSAAMAGVHARYLLSLLLPFGLSVDYPVDPRGTWADPFALAGLVLALAAVYGLVVGVRRRSAVLAFGCGFWVFGLMPVNNLWPTTSILRADRYLLIPAIGAYVFAGAGLARLAAGRVALAGALAAGLAVLAGLRGPVWADSRTLWTDTLAKQPTSAVAFLNRSADASERQAWVGAEADATAGIAAAKALRRPELVLRGHLLRATALLPLGRFDESLAEARAALDGTESLEKNPWFHGDPREIRASAQAAMGRALDNRARQGLDPVLDTQDFDMARRFYEEATVTWPDSYEAWRNLGVLLAARGGEPKRAQAAEALRRAVALMPDDADTTGYLVRVLYTLGKDDEAKALFDATSRRLGSPRGLRRTDAQLSAEVGDPVAADDKLSTLLKEDPRDAETRALLLTLRRRRARDLLAASRNGPDREKSLEAAALFDKALEVHPGDVDSQVGAGDAFLQASRFHDARARYAKARAAAPEARWIANLEARAGALEAVWLTRNGNDTEAARTMAEVVRLAPPRIDLGFSALEAETPWLLPAAEALGGSGAKEGDAMEKATASALLVGAALLVGGDEDGARARLIEAAQAFGSMPDPTSRLGKLYDGCHLLLAMARSRRADVIGARHEMEPVRDRRPGDAVVAYHLLLLDRVETKARKLIAQGGGDAAGVEAATKASDELYERVKKLASSDPPWPGPGLLASELELERGDYVPALKRLTDLATRFPEAPSTHRGVASVYEAQSLLGGQREAMLTEAGEALKRAKRLDPRDPRTALELSQLQRLTGNLPAAAAHAMAAASVEPLPGPASRALGAILVELGRKALDAHEIDKALAQSARAAKVDPGAAGPHLLEGDAWMARQDLEKALAAFRLARAKEPANPTVLHALAECHRMRGGAYLLWRQRYPRPKESVNGSPDASALAAAIAEWDRKNLLAMRKARGEFEEYLRLEPEGAEAETVRNHIALWTSDDPEAIARNASESKKAYEDGEKLRREKSLLEALEKYREAVKLMPENFPAWTRIAEMAISLGSELDVEGIRAAERMRDLDPDFPEADLYLGDIWARRWKAESAATGRGAAAKAAASRARQALERYVSRADGSTERGAVNLTRARRLLDTLPAGN